MQLSQYHQQQQQQQQQQNSRGATATPYQQLKYLYQTENYEYFFKLIDQLTVTIKENRELKSNIFGELNYLQIAARNKNTVPDLQKNANTDHLNDMKLLKDKYKLDTTSDNNETQLKEINAHLNKLLNDKIAYNKQLITLIDDYQMNITMIIKNLYKLFDNRTDDLEAKLETLLNLKLQVLEEFNAKIARLTKLSKLNDVLVS